MALNDDLAARREALLMRIGETWRGDWSGHSFDGRDGRGWIDTALHGNAASLDALDAELDSIDDDR